MTCNFSPAFELARNITYSMFEAIADLCPATYIRPDPGGSMMPWLGSLLLLVFHLPTCVIRAVKWESAQYLALGLAALGIAVTTQAYVSTQLRAEEVLVWMPLTLVLDAGAMLQMVVLIIEKHDERQLPKDHRPQFPRRGSRVLWEALTEAVQHLWKRMTGQNGHFRVGHGAEDGNDVPMENIFGERAHDAGEEGRVQNHALPPLHPDAVRYAAVAIISFLFLLVLVSLQLWGLSKAVVGRRQKSLRVNWCSPGLVGFAVAVTTGNCDKYEVKESSSNGIGCISLPGDQQEDWLLGTIISLSTALTCQILDTVLLLFSDSKSRWRGVKMQRPWLTMFGGVIMLVVLIVFGVFNANHLPPGVTEKVWIYRKEASSAMGKVCQGKLNPPGLRGVVIGYLDGLFESWGNVWTRK